MTPVSDGQLRVAMSVVYAINRPQGGCRANEVLCRNGVTTITVIAPALRTPIARLEAWAGLLKNIGAIEANLPGIYLAQVEREGFVFLLEFHP